MKNDLYNLDLEKHVLGGILRDPDYSQMGLDLLRVSDFYKTFHQQVFQAALDLSARKEPVDLVTVAARLKAKGVDGYASTLADIGDHFPSNMTAYCRKLQDLATRREIKHTALKMSTECDDGTLDTSELLDRYQALILGLDTCQDDTFQDMATMTIQSVNRYGHKHESTGIKTGFYSCGFVFVAVSVDRLYGHGGHILKGVILAGIKAQDKRLVAVQQLGRVQGAVIAFSRHL